MALPLKSGADLYNNQALRLRLHNLGADPTEVGAGLIYFNTSSGLNSSGRVRVYTGSEFKSLAFVDEIANNEAFIALQEKVALLAGDVDTDAIISNMKEVSAFLSGFAEDASLMDYLNTALGKKLDLTGGTIDGNLTVNGNINIQRSSTPLYVTRTTAGPSVIGFYGKDTATSIWGSLGMSAKNNPVYLSSEGTTYTLLHSANFADQIGDYYLKSSGGILQGDSADLFVINRLSSTSSAYITFKGNNSLRGRIGFDANNNPIVQDINYGSGNQTLIHSGNIGECALNISGTNARPTLLTPYENLNDYGYGYYSYVNANNPENGYGTNVALFAFRSYRGNDTWQIAFDGNGINNTAGPNIAIRGNFADIGWTVWYRIATTSSNVASATKLQTARTIWGQLFDGTEDISGNLIIGKQSKDYTTQNYLYLWKGDGTYRHRGMLYVNEDGASYDYYNADTGIYRQLLISPNGLVYNSAVGNSSFFINSSGNVTIGNSDLAGTAYQLYVNEKVGASLYYFAKNKANYGYIGLASSSNNDITISTDSTSKLWLNGNGNTIMNYFGGNVGIGIADPDEKLHVVGNLHVTGNIIADGEVSAGGVGEEGSAGAGSGSQMYATTIGRDTTTTVITHGLATDDIVISIYEKDSTSGLWNMVLTDIEITDANNIRVTFGSATTVEHKVVIFGAVA